MYVYVCLYEHVCMCESMLLGFEKLTNMFHSLGLFSKI